jgi:hypothetical protein
MSMRPALAQKTVAAEEDVSRNRLPDKDAIWFAVKTEAGWARVAQRLPVGSARPPTMTR